MLYVHFKANMLGVLVFVDNILLNKDVIRMSNDFAHNICIIYRSC